MGPITDAKAVELFRSFLRFRTVSSEGHKNGANESAVAFLKQEFDAIGLETRVVEGSEKGKPVLLATWKGKQPELASVLLNSHYDVVPVMEEHWTKPAFDGLLAEDAAWPGGPRIYGRGAQDMKSVCIQYLAAISRLVSAGYVPKRTVHLSYVPDEEVGGGGMSHLVATDAFKNLNVGCAIDEGLSNPEQGKYTVFYGERTPWGIEVTAKGPTGHGSRFIKGMATNMINSWCSRALRYRAAEEKVLHASEAEHGCGHAKCKKLGDVTTVNLTALRAGVSSDGGQTYALNVIPTEAMAGLDIRIALTKPHAEIEELFNKWCRESEAEWDAPEGSLAWGFAPYRGVPLKEHLVSPTGDDNAYWMAFKGAVEGTGAVTEKEVFPAATDSRFLRQLGITAFGFSPISGDPILLHEHDEYLSRSIFEKGCAVYEKLIPAVADC
ncbi:Aminoacylase-1 [Diplonema papillatum]|nr:Aminoacylase-1 [Diplonema papillatum]